MLGFLQSAAKEATPNSDPRRTTNNIHYEIKRLVAEKRRGRSVWQRTNTPDSRRIYEYNRKSNKLKSKLQELRNESFEKYVSNLTREDNSIWKPVKNRRKPKITSPLTRKYSTPRGTWAKREKLNYLQNIFPDNNDQEQGVEQDLATSIHSQERIKAFTLKEIKD